MKSTFNSILNRICNALFGDSWDKVLYFIERLDTALREKYSEAGILYFSIVTLENSGGGVATVNHSHFYQENGEWLKENAKLDLRKTSCQIICARNLRRRSAKSILLLTLNARLRRGSLQNKIWR